MEWSSIKSDVTKHTFSGNGGRQPPSVFFHSPDKCALPCLPRFPSAPLRSPYLHTFRRCRFLSSHLFGAREWIRGPPFIKASHVWELFSFPTIKSQDFTEGALQTGNKKKKKGWKFLVRVFSRFPRSIGESLHANARED